MKLTRRDFTTLLALYILTKFFSTCGAYNLMCEELPIELCAYSVSSTGARCVLEAEIMNIRNKDVLYKCQTSSVMGKSSEGWIESDDCMAACGVSRMTVGISTDSLSDARALQHLCSPRCSQSCPHLFLLHNDLAIAESSSSLQDVCKTLNRPHRGLGEFGGQYRASRGNHGFFGGDCGLFGCGGGRSAPPPETRKANGQYYFGDNGPHGGRDGRHGWKGGVFDPFFRPFYPYYPSSDSLPPSSFDIPPSPSPIISE